MARLTTYKEVRIEIRFAIYLAKRYMCLRVFKETIIEGKKVCVKQKKKNLDLQVQVLPG